MFKKLFFGITIIMVSIVFDASFADDAYINGKKHSHDNLSAEATTKKTGIIKFKYSARARADAPSNADGNYDVLAKVDGDIGEHYKSGYLGGIRAIANSSVKKYVWEVPPHPKMTAKAKINGNFLLGSPGNMIVHYPDPSKHSVEKP